MNSVLFAFFLAILAGIISGSFAFPVKYATKWRFENIWLCFSSWTFFILPCISVPFLLPQIIKIYSIAPLSLSAIVCIGGFIFGIGQVLFALAIGFVGMSLAFVIALGLATGLGFLLPLVIQHPNQILTPFGLITMFGTALALGGLMISNHAGKLRHRNKQAEAVAIFSERKRHNLGIFLAIISGTISATQNFVFSYTFDLQQLALLHGATNFGAAIIVWPVYLVFAFIPYLTFMIFLHIKNKSFTNYKNKVSAIYCFYALMMGLCWYGALLIYSKASQMIGVLGPLVGWPLYLVSIILISNFLGWWQGEWKDAGKKAHRTLITGLILMTLAVAVLGYGASFNS